MPATGASGRASGTAGAAPALTPGACGQREFPGDAGQLRVLRQWLAALLPPCPGRDDVIMVAHELGSNAIAHTRSGQGGRFTVEVTWSGAVVRVAVADGGAATGPAEIDDPGAEHGRGLAVVRELSVRTGVCGDHLGRLVWAEVLWTGQAGAVVVSPARQEAAIDEGTVGTRRCGRLPAWFGSAACAWRMLAGRAGLVAAPPAPVLAALLRRPPGARPRVQDDNTASADQHMRLRTGAYAASRPTSHARPVSPSRHGGASEETAPDA
jgi:hypothetical protein